MILTKDRGQRMWGGGFGIGSGGSSGGGGGGGGVSSEWVDANYISKEFFNQLFKVKATVTSTEGGQTVTQEIDLLPNALVDGTSVTLKSVKVEAGLWTESFLSALGLNPGGGGGLTLNEPLASINSASLGTPTAAGQVITWNGTQWIYSIPSGGGGGGGTVTNVSTGTGLTGGPITTFGTIEINITYQTYIGHGETAYNWGDHAQAGYASSSSVSTLQGYFDGSGNAKTALKLTTVSKTAWGQTYWTSVGVPDNVSGDISAGANGGAINQFHSIELNSANSLSSEGHYGGFIDFHLDGSAADYTLRLIEENVAGVLSIFGKDSTSPYADKLVGVKIGSNVTGASYLQIGDVRIIYDYANNALKVQKADGTAANLYATGGVSALGVWAGSGGSIEDLNMTGTLTFVGAEYDHQLYGDPDGYLNIISSEGIKMSGDVDLQGFGLNMTGGNIDGANYVSGKRFYVGTNRYLYLDTTNNILKYYDNGTTRTIAFS